MIAFLVEAPLTLAGHACWPIAGLAHAVVDGGAAGLGGVLCIRARQAGPWASWSSLWFIGARRTSCGGQRRYRFHDQKKKKKKENLDSGHVAKSIQALNWKITTYLWDCSSDNYGQVAWKCCVTAPPHNRTTNRISKYFPISIKTLDHLTLKTFKHVSN